MLFLAIGVEKIVASLARANALLLIPAFLLMATIIAFKSLRYAFLASRVGGSLRPLFGIAAFGLLFNQLSVAASEVSKAALFKRLSGVPAAAALAPSLVERFTDILVLGLFALLGSLGYLKGTPMLLLSASVSVPFLGRLMRDFKKAYGMIGTRLLLLTIAMTAGLWLAESIVFQAIFLALGFPLPFFENLGAVSLSFLIPTSILFTIGGLEANMVVLYSFLGVPPATVLAGAVVYRVFVISSAGALSCLSLRGLRGRRR